MSSLFICLFKVPCVSFVLFLLYCSFLWMLTWFRFLTFLKLFFHHDLLCSFSKHIMKIIDTTLQLFLLCKTCYWFITKCMRWLHFTILSIHMVMKVTGIFTLKILSLFSASIQRAKRRQWVCAAIFERYSWHVWHFTFIAIQHCVCHM